MVLVRIDDGLLPFLLPGKSLAVRALNHLNTGPLAYRGPQVASEAIMAKNAAYVGAILFACMIGAVGVVALSFLFFDFW